MSDDWLFDRTGPVDLEVARLERELAVFRHRPPRRRAPALALAAAAALAVGFGVWWASRPPPAWSAQTASCDGCVWEPGSALDTRIDASTRIADRGVLQAKAGSVVRRLPGEGARLALDQGQIEVEVKAPARWLIVDLPGVALVDLGCAYTARVEAGGHGLVAVTSGWVALEGSGPVTQVPAGTRAATWPTGHTGLPVEAQASDALIRAVDAWDRGQPALDAVLAAAVRPEDALTVWHLVARVDPADRARVVAALDALVPGALPDPAGLIALEPTAVEGSLGYVVAATL